VTGKMFRFYATVNEVHDGDTLYGWIDQGIGQWSHGAAKNGIGLRLNGCNARELSEPGGPEARDHLASLIPVGTVLPITSVSWDKYSNRLDVTVTMPDGSDLVSALIAEQWAVAWDGTGTKPVPPWPRTVTP
jgi:endonuclease YncB( thermonuclease family)